MAFIGILPLVVAMTGFILAIFAFIGISLLLIGITGMIMNKIYKAQTKADRGVAKPLSNVGAIVLGIVIFLFPLGYMVVGMIATLINS